MEILQKLNGTSLSAFGGSGFRYKRLISKTSDFLLVSKILSSEIAADNLRFAIN
jgi:hypothetical protein